jgi:hypothetical protein
MLTNVQQDVHNNIIIFRFWNGISHHGYFKTLEKLLKKYLMPFF